MRLLRNSPRYDDSHAHTAFAVIVLFFGLAFVDSLVAREWSMAIVFALVAVLAVYVDRRRAHSDRSSS